MQKEKCSCYPASLLTWTCVYVCLCLCACAFVCHVSCSIGSQWDEQVSSAPPRTLDLWVLLWVWGCRSRQRAVYSRWPRPAQSVSLWPYCCKTVYLGSLAAVGMRPCSHAKLCVMQRVAEVESSVRHIHTPHTKKLLQWTHWSTTENLFSQNFLHATTKYWKSIIW